MSEPQTTPDQNSDNDARRNETPATGLPGQGEVPAGTTLEEDTICHDAVDPRTYGPNTPTKRTSSSGAWREIKCLKGPEPEDKATHICIVRLDKHEPQDPPQFCNARLKLTRGKAGANGHASWLTTKCIEHLRDEHPMDSEMGKKYAEALAHRQSEIVGQQMEYGMIGPDGKTKVGTGGGTFTLNKREKSLSAQAQWFVYSSMQISKSEFDSVWFKNMLQEVGDGEKTAILTKDASSWRSSWCSWSS